MKNLKYLAFMLTCLFLVVSCKTGTSETTPVLTLSEESAQFGTSAGEKIISVTAINEGDAILPAWIGADWGKVSLSSDGKSMAIIVFDNNSEETRTAKVDVMLRNGNLKKTITVTQVGVGKELELAPDEISVSQLAASDIIYVMTNQGDWSVSIVESNLNWVRVLPNYEKNMVTVEIDENENRADRTAQIKLVAGTSEKIITVKQTGAMYYILPYIDKIGLGMRTSNAIRFENNRGSIQLDLDRSRYPFITLSPIMPDITYIARDIRTGGYDIVTIFMDVPDITFFDAPDYRKFLKDNGFEYLFQAEENNVDVYWRESDRVQMLLIRNQKRILISHFESAPYDPADLPVFETFSEYPYGFNKWGASVEEIKAYEQLNGGVLLDETNVYIEYTAPKSQLPLLYNVYNYGSAKAMYETHKIYNNLHIGMYRNAVTTTLTPEFKALLATNGFEYYVDYGDGTVYLNVEKNVYAYFRNVAVSDFDGMSGYPVFVIQQSAIPQTKP